MSFTKNEAFVELDNREMPFIVWGRYRTYLGCNDMIIKMMDRVYFPEVEDELQSVNDIKLDLIYYPSIVAGRVVAGYDDGAVNLYPYRKRKTVTLDSNPLNEKIGASKMREVLEDKLDKPLKRKPVIKDGWDDDNYILDTGYGDDIIVEKDLVDIFEVVTDIDIEEIDGKVKEDKFIGVNKNVNVIISKSEEVPD